MISAFQSRAFGFGMPAMEEQLRKVNEVRKGQHYQDKKAAMKYLGSSKKGALRVSPFIIEFEYGAGNEDTGIMKGWCYNRRIVPMS